METKARVIDVMRTILRLRNCVETAIKEDGVECGSWREMKLLSVVERFARVFLSRLVCSRSNCDILYIFRMNTLESTIAPYLLAVMRPNVVSSLLDCSTARPITANSSRSVPLAPHSGVSVLLVVPSWYG